MRVHVPHDGAGGAENAPDRGAGPSSACLPLPRLPWRAAALTLLLCAAPAQGQAPPAAPDPPPLDRLVSLRLRNVPLETALENLARAAALRLSFSRDLLPLDRRVSLERERLPAGAALRLLLDGTGVEVSVTRSGQVVLAPGPAPAALAAQVAAGPAWVGGRVVDAVTGVGLAAVEVAAGDSGPRTLTDADGRYQLEIPAGARAQLAVQRFGYSPAFARLPEPADGQRATLDFSLHPLAVSLGALEVVTERQRRTGRRDQTDARITLSAADLSRAQIRRLDELFRGAVPGMVAWNLGASPVLRFGSIRGATSLALNAPKVYVDGVEIANPVYLGSLDPATIERIEVIRGPQGAALFGSDAIGGVVQIVTRKGTPARTPELTVDSRSAGGWLESVAGNRGGWLLDQALTASLAAPHLGMAAGGSLLRLGERAEGGGERRAAFAGLRLAGGPLAAELSARGSVYAWESPVNAVLRANGLR
ncbi:MAG: TonB-dependent receptor plug domain-containing protein, partial [Gemmatimonadetes bacterium]|nr:TonB-dependent receptor plug domain-containing protein [Gemmatimonadota bacterium]